MDMKAIYQINIFRKSNYQFVLIFLFICSCQTNENNRTKESKPINKDTLMKLTNKCNNGLKDKPNAYYQFYKKVIDSSMNYNAPYKKSLKSFFSNCNSSMYDYTLFFKTISKLNDESLSEELGNKTFEILKMCTSKGDTILYYLNKIPQQEKTKILTKIINSMSIDLIGDKYNYSKFKNDFPFFSDSLSVQTAKKIFENADVGESK